MARAEKAEAMTRQRRREAMAVLVVPKEREAEVLGPEAPEAQAVRQLTDLRYHTCASTQGCAT